MQVENHALKSGQIPIPLGRAAPVTSADLPKSSQLKQFSEADRALISLFQEQGLLQLKLLPTLEIEQDAQGEIRVGGFPPGCPPPIAEIIACVFPQARSVEMLTETHDRPFDTYTFRIEGRLYKSSFLSGGFAPSKKLSIQPL